MGGADIIAEYLGTLADLVEETSKLEAELEHETSATQRAFLCGRIAERAEIAAVFRAEVDRQRAKAAA